MQVYNNTELTKPTLLCAIYVNARREAANKFQIQEDIMSYWGSPGTLPPWGISRGPSPVVPLLLVVALGWVIYSETLMGWYEQVTEVQETVTDNALVLVLAVGLLLVVVFLGNWSEVVLVPLALVLVVFLIQNIMVSALLLLVVAYFAGIYYYRPDRGYGASSSNGEWSGGGLGFYMLLLLCLVLCAMFSEEGSWWIPSVLLIACVLCFTLFSGGKVLGYEYF